MLAALVVAGGAPTVPAADAKVRCAKEAKRSGKGAGAKRTRCVRRTPCPRRASSKAARRKLKAARRLKAGRKPIAARKRGCRPAKGRSPSAGPDGRSPAAPGDGPSPAPDAQAPAVPDPGPDAPDSEAPAPPPTVQPPSTCCEEPPASGQPDLPPTVQKPIRELRFARDSVWDAPLPADVPIDPESHARLDPMLDHVEARQADMFFPSISISSYSTPVYIVPADQPRVPVTLDAWNPSFKRALGEGVPIPSNARAAAGTDGHLTVYQPSTDSMWEFWKASKRDDGWHAAWGGAMRHVSTSAGYYDDDAWPGLTGIQGFNWGSTATSLPVAGGLITIQDLREGRIDHALAASVPFACRDSFLFPAQRTDGLSTRADCMPQGARLRLDPDLDVDALKIPPVTKLIAKAAQRYGIVVRDKTGGQSIALFAEQVQSGDPNVYGGADGLLGGYPGWSLLGKFPWRKLELVRSRSCEQAPCLPAG